MSNMEISELTDTILSDDYEEGEILDEDTLYDNVSSLEEFSGSDTDIKYDSSVLINKLTSNGRKEKYHRRKEHKCKEESICRKERSGKHCYARIRKNKTIEISEKSKVIDLTSTHCNEIHNHKKKTHVILSPVHDGASKYNTNRRPIAHKDVPEKENRSSHRHSRYYESHKSPPYRIDKKKFSEKIKKHLVNASARSHDNRKRARSQSPRSHYKNHIKETNAPRGGSSLLKRLVGSGSIGVKTPKEVEEPKKLVDKCDMELSKSLVNDEKFTEIIKESESVPKKEDIKTIAESEKISCVEENASETISENMISLDDSFENLLLADTLSESHGTDDFTAATEGGDAVKTINNDNDIPDTNTNCESSENIPSMNSDASKITANREELNEENIYKNDLSNEYDSLKKNDQLNDEEIDELSLRLEALRTAMLRKHKERQKRGFIRKKKTTIEDDSFAEYALSHVDLDNSTLDNNTEGTDNEKNNNGLVLDSNCTNYTSPGGSNNIPLQYNGSSEFPYYQVNSNELSDEFSNSRDVNEDFTCFIKSHRSINQASNNSVAHCLKEINSNKEHLTESKKRIKRLSSKYKSRRSKGLDSAKRRYGRAVMERKLFRREYAEQKRLRKGCMKDLNIIKTDAHVDNQLNDGGSDEECALRELALKSVKEKEKVMNNNETSDTGFIQSTKDNLGFRNEQIKVVDQDIFSNLSIDIDNNINVRPLVSCDSESTPTNLSSNEWDDIDEDILRAQLLSSLSLRIKKEEELNKNTTQVFSKKQAKALLKARNLEIISDKKLKLVRQKINKENFKKISRNKLLESAKRKAGIVRANSLFKKTIEKHEPGLNTKSVPVVPKFIISVNGDSSSEEDDDSNQTDVVRSIDLFLQEVRIENDLKQGLVNQQIDSTFSKENQVKSDEVLKPIAEVKSVDKNNMDTNVSDAAQIVSDKLVNVKHLPIWQQQEYHRLKKQIEEKERVIKTTKEKVLTTFEKEDIEKDVKFQKKDTEKINKNLENNEPITRNKINNNETDKEGLSNISVINGINSSISNDVINKEANPQSNIKSIVNSPKHIINSYKLVQEVSHMSKMIEYLEKEMNSFRDMYKILVQKKKELLIAKLNIAKKKKVLFEIRKKLVSKEKLIQNRMEQSSFTQLITKTDQNDAKKQVSRDLELCKLRMREFNLRSKMIFDEIDHSGLTKLTKQTKGVSPIEKTILPLKSNQNSSVLSQKILTVPKAQATIKEKSINKNSAAINKPDSVAEKQTETWDPFVPVCPFDLSGVCKDEECKFQHIKAA